MVLPLEGNLEHAAHAWRKIGLFGEKHPIYGYSRYNQMLYKDQITEIAPYMRTYFVVTI